MQQQSVNSQKGEIEFRRKIFQQQVEGKKVFNDEFDARGIEEILRDRMKKTFEQMRLLKERGVRLSPYVEIGAERGQRALVMENDLHATGAAIDISYDMLKSCEYYKNVFHKKKLPLRICCDANHLPFMSHSVPFVFCYETLHHFPDPTPIVKEIHRILAFGGYFFFDEEPYKKILHIDLYRRKKLYSEESLKRSLLKRAFDYFLSMRNCNEIVYGVIENENMSIAMWKKALCVFEEKQVTLQSPVKPIASPLFDSKQYLKFLLAYLLGGEISGVCRKSGTPTDKEISVYDMLICPSCLEKGHESRLTQRNLLFFCSKCGCKFPIIDGVIFLFSYQKFRVLYPEIFKKVIKGQKKKT